MRWDGFRFAENTFASALALDDEKAASPVPYRLPRLDRGLDVMVHVKKV